MPLISGLPMFAIAHALWRIGRMTWLKNKWQQFLVWLDEIKEPFDIWED